MSPGPYKLTYFDFRGLAEPIRLVFAVAGVDYEDIRLKRENWGDLKANYPWGTLPVLHEGDNVLSQSCVILRYLGKKYNLVGSNDFETAKCDELVEAMNDLRIAIFSSYHETDEARKAAANKAFLEEKLPKFLSVMSSTLENNGGKYLVGNGITIADLSIASYLQTFNESELYADKHILEPYPLVVAHQETVFSTPGIREWIEKRPKTQF